MFAADYYVGTGGQKIEDGRFQEPTWWQGLQVARQQPLVEAPCHESTVILAYAGDVHGRLPDTIEPEAEAYYQ